MNVPRSPLGGKLISQQQAYKGLGDPKTWERDAKILMMEFATKPARKQEKTSLLASAVAKVRAAVHSRRKQEAELVFAKRRKRKRKPARPGRKKGRSK
jgi:hypothetical protein